MTAAATSGQRLLALLPAIYAQDPFLGQYLGAFENLFEQLEQRIESLSTHFDPLQTPTEFLPWLSSWVAFTLHADISETQQRAFLARIVPLYRRRGTAQNMRELLSIFTRGTPVVDNSSTQPHHFDVTISLPEESTPGAQQRQIAVARALIELEKPAHTTFTLNPLFPAMKLGVISTIGVDTLLGLGRDR